MITLLKNYHLSFLIIVLSVEFPKKIVFATMKRVDEEKDLKDIFKTSIIKYFQYSFTL